MTVVCERPVRFEDVDAARLVFFGRYFGYCHDAMEAVFAPLDRGYPGLILDRGIGFPAVHVEADYVAPLRYGDGVRISVDVLHIGHTSITLRYEMNRTSDGARVATIRHVVVVTRLASLRPEPIPDDVRALLERHRVGEG